jgi:SNF family Na+-dependent transporter
MLAHYILAGAMFIAVFIMFLVIARTLNSIINLLTKLEYLVQKEYDLKKELVEVRKLMEEKPVESAPDAKPAPAKPKPAK